MRLAWRTYIKGSYIKDSTQLSLKTFDLKGLGFFLLNFSTTLYIVLVDKVSDVI